MRPTEESLQEQHPGAWEEFVVVHRYQRADFDGKCLLDVGAHVGFVSLLALAWGARRVLAVEPDPDNLARLRQNLAPYADLATIIAGACGPAGRARLIDSDSNAKIVPARDGAVICRPLGELAVMLDPDDDDMTLKVDTEGHEPEIMLGAAARDIRRFSAIMLETHQTPHKADHAARRAQFLLDYMSFMGYEETNREPLCWWQPEPDGKMKCVSVPEMVAVRLKRIDRP